MVMRILDMTAGSRMFWWNKNNPLVTFVDKREGDYDIGTYETKQGTIPRKASVHPDIIADWTKRIPFDDKCFDVVVFDPPHLIHAGKDSWLANKYGVLNQDTWKEDLRHGFDEGFRVLKDTGILVFKWNDDQIKLRQVLEAIGYVPLFGDKRSKTHWIFFNRRNG